MEPSLFSRIITGEIPCHKIYEDAKTFAFLDIHPKQPGHVLVVPKEQVEFIWDLPPEEYQAVMATAQKVGQHARRVLRPKHVGMMVEGLGVPHAHVHVFPFATTTDYHAPADLEAEPDHAALAQMAETLRMEDDL